MSEIQDVKYVFLDVVEFTKNRSVEAQADVIQVLNDAVQETLRPVLGYELDEGEERISIPTGDGIAIALIHNKKIDGHLKIACEILRRVSRHNAESGSDMRRFVVRVGLNENADNIIKDINGRRNVAGAGISAAQRIMEKADGGQILVGQAVFDRLHFREKYMHAFRKFEATDKHGAPFTVYQFMGIPELQGDWLNVQWPAAFKSKQQVAPKLTKMVAFYLAHACKAEQFLKSRTSDATRNDTATILLYSLAEDAEALSNTPAHEEASRHTWSNGKATFEQQFDHYRQIDSWIRIRMAALLQTRYLEAYDNCFECGSLGRNFVFVNKHGIEKLVAEWPTIAEEFGISTGLTKQK